MSDDDAIWKKFEVLEDRLQKTEIEMTKQLTKMNEQIATLISLAQGYVTKERFQIVQILVYGFAAIILTSVMGAIIAKAITK